MTRRLDAIWRILREHAAPRHPDTVWRELLGEEYAVVSGLLRASRGRARHWPCGVLGGEGCARRVVEHAYDDLVAVCGGDVPRCDSVVLQRRQLALRTLDLRGLAEVFAQTSGLAETPVRPDGRRVLAGPVPFGAHSLLVGLTSQTRGHHLIAWAQELRDRHAVGPLLVLAPLAGPLDSATARTLSLLQTDVVPMGEVMVAGDSGITADLSSWVLARRTTLVGIDPLALLTRRYRLVLDPDRKRIGWAGRWHSLERKLHAHRLLLALARSAGVVATRNELFDEVWPGDSPANKQGWENTLRSHKAHLDKAFGKGVVQSVRGDLFTGGYVLRLDSTDIAWWSATGD